MSEVYSNYDHHEYKKKRIREGYIDTLGRPLKCDCGATENELITEKPDKSGDYYVHCSLCDEDVGQWMAEEGCWNPRFF